MTDIYTGDPLLERQLPPIQTYYVNAICRAVLHEVQSFLISMADSCAHTNLIVSVPAAQFAGPMLPTAPSQ